MSDHLPEHNTNTKNLETILTEQKQQIEARTDIDEHKKTKLIAGLESIHFKVQKGTLNTLSEEKKKEYVHTAFTNLSEIVTKASASLTELETAIRNTRIKDDVAQQTLQEKTSGSIVEHTAVGNSTITTLYQKLEELQKTTTDKEITTLLSLLSSYYQQLTAGKQHLNFALRDKFFSTTNSLLTLCKEKTIPLPKEIATLTREQIEASENLWRARIYDPSSYQNFTLPETLQTHPNTPVNLSVDISKERSEIETKNSNSPLQRFQNEIRREEKGKARPYQEILKTLNSNPEYKKFYMDWHTKEDKKAEEKRTFTYGSLGNTYSAETAKQVGSIDPSVRVQSIAEYKDEQGKNYKEYRHVEYEPNIFNKPIGILWHFTTSATFAQTMNVFNGADAKSVHYIVGKDGTLVQLLPDGYICKGAHFGEPPRFLNAGFIQIEVEAPNRGAITEPQMKTLKALTKAKAQVYGIPPENIVGHGEVDTLNHGEHDGDKQDFLPKDKDLLGVREEIRKMG